jgi:hypothetical protein
VHFGDKIGRNAPLFGPKYDQPVEDPSTISEILNFDSSTSLRALVDRTHSTNWLSMVGSTYKGCCSCSDEMLNITAVAVVSVVTAAIFQVHHLAAAAHYQQEQ